jgi:DNA-binding Lrp family transcriptional regulator
MRVQKLDKIDRKILRHLQEDGRMSNVDLAKHVGISAPPCLRRVRGLEDEGYIISYHAKLSPSALGFGIIVFAQVKLTSNAETDLKKFEAHVGALPAVRECHLVSGDMDYLIKIVAKDWDGYQRFLTTELTAAPGVSSIKSSLCVRAAKEEPGVPVED